MKIRSIVLVIFFLFIGFVAHCEDPGTLSITLTPGGGVPVGDSASYFKFGGGASLSAGLSMAFLPLLSFRADLGYRYVPIRTQDGVSLLSLGVGAEGNFLLINKLTISPYVVGGYYYGFLTDGSRSSGGNIYVSGGLGAYYKILPSISLSLNSCSS